MLFRFILFGHHQVVQLMSGSDIASLWDNQVDQTSIVVDFLK
jgi:hypothetical protein